jgi:MYXO-CTERM domain-containing protein
VWPGKADGSFGSAVASFDGTLNAANVDGSGHFIVGVADVTGDGRADLASVADDGSAYVWPGQASGAFGSAVASFDGTLDAANVDGTGHYITGLADVTGDGRADLVSASDDGSAYVWPGQASAKFGSAVPSFGGTLDAANVDGSGHFIVAPSGPSPFDLEEPPAGSGGNGGAAGTAGGAGNPGWAGGTGNGGGAGSDGEPDADALDPEPEGSCACRSTGGGSKTPTWLALLSFGAFGALRRRRA